VKPSWFETILKQFQQTLDQLEAFVLQFIFAIIPWLAPIPSAILIAKATMNHLKWSLPLGIITALIIEGIGITSIKLSLELHHYNMSRRKTDDPAPFILTIGLVAIYFIAAISLTVLLDIFPEIARYAPMIFPIFTIIGGVNIALWGEHKLRLRIIEIDKLERKVKRQEERSELGKQVVKSVPEKVSNIVDLSTNLEKLHLAKIEKQNERMHKLLDAYRKKPDMTPTEAAEILDVSRTTVYSYIDHLTEQGQLRRNGHGMIVTEH